MNAPPNSRTFKFGNSKAVSLPKGFGFGIGKDVVIEVGTYKEHVSGVNDFGCVLL